MDKNSGLPLLLGALIGAALAVPITYAAKSSPEPKVEWEVMVKPPFVRVMVDGKPHELPGHLKLPTPAVPNDGKKRGDLSPTAKPVPDGKCHCDPCNCVNCACHLTKVISTQIEQRGGTGGGKNPEILGIESLVSILKDLKEAIFGANGKPGLRDDIAKGIRDFYDSVRTGVLVVGGMFFVMLGWIGLSLQRIADAQAKIAASSG